MLTLSHPLLSSLFLLPSSFFLLSSSFFILLSSLFFLPSSFFCLPWAILAPLREFALCCSRHPGDIRGRSRVLPPLLNLILFVLRLDLQQGSLKIIISRFSSSRLSSTSFFVFFVLTCNRVLPGFVWDASGLMGLAADVGASRHAPVIPRLLQLFPTPTLGRCLSTLVAAAQHSVPSPLRWASPQKPLTLRREARLGGGPHLF